MLKSINTLQFFLVEKLLFQPLWTCLFKEESTSDGDSRNKITWNNMRQF
jgi:hypothetical protein